MIDLLSKLAEHGVVGLLLGIVLVAYKRKDDAHAAEQKARVDDVKVLFEIIDKITDREVVLERRELAADRRERDLERRELEIAKREAEMTVRRGPR